MFCTVVVSILLNFNLSIWHTNVFVAPSENIGERVAFHNQTRQTLWRCTSQDLICFMKRMPGKIEIVFSVAVLVMSIEANKVRGRYFQVCNGYSLEIIMSQPRGKKRHTHLSFFFFLNLVKE